MSFGRQKNEIMMEKIYSTVHVKTLYVKVQCWAYEYPQANGQVEKIVRKIKSWTI